MSERVRSKVTLAIAALGMVTLLQGCGGDDTTYGIMWAPINSTSLPWFFGDVTPGTTVVIGTTTP